MTEACPTPPPGGVSEQVNLNATTPAEALAFTMVHLGGLADLCQWGLSNQIVTGLIMQFLRNHFSTPSTIMGPTLKQYVWQPSTAAAADTASKLLITNFTTFNPMTGQLPALVVKRGDQTNGRLVLNDLNQTKPDALADGQRNFVRMKTGVHTVYCMSSADGEAEALGDEVFDSLSFMSPIFVEQLPFHNFEVVSHGELGILDDLGNKLGVPITINYAYEYGWTVQSLAPKIKTIGLYAR